MRLPGLHSHEFLAAEAITRGDVAEVLRTQWQLDPLVVADMVIGRSATPEKQVLTTMLSGAIDIDKMDYLVRDSHHAGVPYGMNFDEQRLIESLCLDESGTRLAITEKGRTAAEMMVFARYVMFSEVYWHHAVRAATAMLQRAVWVVQDLAPSGWFTSLDDSTFSETLLQLATGTPAAELVEGIFGPRRRLWKRAASFHQHEHQEIHQLLSGRSYADLLLVSGGVAEALSRRLSITIDPMLLLIDALPKIGRWSLQLMCDQRLVPRTSMEIPRRTLPDGACRGMSSLTISSNVSVFLLHQSLSSRFKASRILQTSCIKRHANGC